MRSKLGLLLAVGTLASVAFGQPTEPPEVRPSFDEAIELIEELGPDQVREMIWDELGWPEREPFSHAIGPNAGTMQGRLLWLTPRFEDNETYPAEGLAIDLKRLCVRDPEWDNLDQALETLAKNADVIEALLSASHLPVVPVEFDGSFPSRTLPKGDPRLGSLGTLRKASRLLRADAVRAWHAGDRHGSIERAAAMLRLAQPPAAGDGMMFGLIRASMLEYSHELIEALAIQQLTAAERATLLEAASGFSTADPCRIRDQWTRQTDEMLQFAQAGLQNGEVSDELIFVLSQLLATQQMINAMLSVFSDAMDGKPSELTAENIRSKSMDGLRELWENDERFQHEALQQAAELAAGLLAEAQAGWDQADASTLLENIDERAKADASGLAGMIVVAPDGIHRDWLESCSHLAAILAWLRD